MRQAKVQGSQAKGKYPANTSRGYCLIHARDSGHSAGHTSGLSPTGVKEAALFISMHLLVSHWLRIPLPTPSHIPKPPSTQVKLFLESWMQSICKDIYTLVVRSKSILKASVHKNGEEI